MLIGIGGSLGAMARYATQLLFTYWNISSYWAIATANLAGCFFIGFFAAAIFSNHPVLSISIGHSGDGKLWLFGATGVLGGYTTFSSFGLHLLEMGQKSQFPEMLLYSFGSLGGGLLFCVSGFYLFRFLFLA